LTFFSSPGSWRRGRQVVCQAPHYRGKLASRETLVDQKPARPSQQVPPTLRPGRIARAAGRTLNSSTIGVLPILDRFFDRLRLKSILQDHLPREDRAERTRTLTQVLSRRADDADEPNPYKGSRFRSQGNARARHISRPRSRMLELRPNHLTRPERWCTPGPSFQLLTSSDHALTTVVSIRSGSDRLEAPRADALIDCSDRRFCGCLDSWIP
jgi:hypothetical protein